MSAYPQDFYLTRNQKTVYSANTIISILLECIGKINSAVDVGCGVGTWLSVLREKGVEYVQGIDGEWVEQDLLVIPKTCFTQMDLSGSKLTLPRRFDLAISLEVAEHLAPERAEEFVSSLAALSDHVLFSAAIPFQGGSNHVNEQWQDYWVELFSAQGYVVSDFIRPKIWNDEAIPVWYRQNVLFFSKRQKLGDVPIDNPPSATPPMPLSIVHPQLYLSRINAQSGLKASFRQFRRSLRDHLKFK